MVCFISSSCTRRSPLVWKWGSLSHQVAPSSILERRGKGGCSFVLAQVWIVSVCAAGLRRRLMAPLWLVLTHNWEIEPSQWGKYLSLLQWLHCLEIIHLTTSFGGYFWPCWGPWFSKESLGNSPVIFYYTILILWIYTIQMFWRSVNSEKGKRCLTEQQVLPPVWLLKCWQCSKRKNIFIPMNDKSKELHIMQYMCVQGQYIYSWARET